MRQETKNGRRDYEGKNRKEQQGVDQQKKIRKDGKTIQKQQNCDNTLITWSVNKKNEKQEEQNKYLNKYMKMRKGQGQRTEEVQCKITKRTHPRKETQRCIRRKIKKR